MQRFVEIAVAVAGIYAAVGALFAVVFHLVGITRVDPAVRGAGIPFRLLITPGVVALWPWLLGQWRRAHRTGPVFGSANRPVTSAGLRRWHRRLTFLLAVLVPGVAAVALIARPAPIPHVPARGIVQTAAALPHELSTHGDAFGSLPVDVTLRGDGAGGVQVELHAREHLGWPDLVLYQVPAGEPFPQRAVFLGRIWGPGVRRYELPSGAPVGELVVYSLSRGEQVAAFRP